MKRRALITATFVVLLASRHATADEHNLHLDLGEGVGLELDLVPAGTFHEGSLAGERGREDGETSHEVRLTEAYYIGRFPVTVGQYARFASASGYRTEAERGKSGGFGWDGKSLVQRGEFTWKSPGFPQTDDHPVTLVTYEDALAFAAWLSRTHGRSFTLPTEAQWEHAYRAGTTTAFYEGKTDADVLLLGWFKRNAGKGTHPVAQKKPNALGLYDMAGNVSEWCLDWYVPYAAGAAVDPLVTQPDPNDKPRRVLRGGSWLQDPIHGRAAARGRSAPGSRNADNGFRVVAAIHGSPPPPPPPAAPPPAAKPEPPPPPPSHASSSGPACVGTLLGSAVLFLIWLWRTFSGRTLPNPSTPPAPRLRPPGPRVSGRSASPLRLQAATDGFRIFAPSTHAGYVLMYSHRGPSGIQQGQVQIEPSDAGQFVYTGFEPTDLTIVSIGGSGSETEPLSAPVSAPGPQFETIETSAPAEDVSFRGFPPAY
jgi:formylglycine-generating enzyme required for sulfatase activity